MFRELPCGSAGKESTCNAGDLGLILGLGRSPGEAKGYPLQYSDLENSMNCIVHRVAKCQTGLSDFHFHPRLGDRAICFIRSTNSHVNLIQKHPHRLN